MNVVTCFRKESQEVGGSMRKRARRIEEDFAEWKILESLSLQNWDDKEEEEEEENEEIKIWGRVEMEPSKQTEFLAKLSPICPL